MSGRPEDAIELLKRVRMDLTNAQAKLSDAMNQIAALDVPETPEWRCEPCTQTFRSPYTLAEHNYRKHNAPLPAHWVDLESRTVNGLGEPHLPSQDLDTTHDGCRVPDSSLKGAA